MRFMCVHLFYLLPTIASVYSNSYAPREPHDGIATFRIPFHASVQFNKGGMYEPLCGGTVIHKRFVVTAAHCFHEHHTPSTLSVVVGSNRLVLGSGPRHRVAALLIHENFHLAALSGRDIALIKLENAMHLDGKYQDKLDFRVTFDVSKTPTRGFLLGWGVKATEGSQLELISFKTFDSTSCRRERGFVYLSATDVCAISIKGRGACPGDSGGPLVSLDFKHIYGLMSYGRESCKTGAAYAFTNLYPLTDWILTNMRKMMLGESGDNSLYD